MERLVIALVVAAVAVGVAVVLQRRRPDAPTQPSAWQTPSQLDPADWPGWPAAGAVVVFTSDTCRTCATAVERADGLVTDRLVAVVSLQQRPDLHERYAVGAVPITVVADGDGVVTADWVGPPSTDDLRAAVGTG